MRIAYAAHTDSCTFFLDDDGVCRQIVRRASTLRGGIPGKGEPDSIARCIGAQYVASLDVSIHGGLVALPTVGIPMLFAYVGDAGRIALVRTGPVAKFETKRPMRPESGIRVKSGAGADETGVVIPLAIPRAPTTPAAAESGIDVDVDLDLSEAGEPELDEQHTHRFHRSMLAPVASRSDATSSRGFGPPRITPTPPPPSYTRTTPTPVVRHVTIVPPPRSSAQTLQIETPPRKRRGVLPARAR